ncbi:MAG: hypothetical protein WBQ86_06020 [Candidatus Binatus sp.]
MPEQRLQASTLHSRHRLITGEGVPGIMQTQIFEPRTLHCPMKGHRHLMRFEWEEPTIIDARRQRLQSFVCGIVQVDMARLTVLGFIERGDPVAPID